MTLTLLYAMSAQVICTVVLGMDLGDACTVPSSDVLLVSSDVLLAHVPSSDVLLVLLCCIAQVICKVVLGLDLSRGERLEMETEFRTWLKHVSVTLSARGGRYCNEWADGVTEMAMCSGL
jgi:hypothetical protein